MEAGVFCLTLPKEVWRGEDVSSRPTTAFLNVFNKVASAAGLKTSGADSANMFEDPASGLAEYEVGAAIIDLDEEFCEQANVWSGKVSVKGAVRVNVEWQVYARLQGKVVAKITTSGGAKQDKGTATGMVDLFNDAFGQNVLALLASKEFIAAVGSAPQVADQPSSTAGLSPLLLGGARGPLSVPDSSGSVVAVFAGSGFGSGWIVADDYLLTNHHVVSDAQSVRIRWSDGLESVGTVVRSDKRRDVALIKVDTRGRPPLQLRLQPVQPGDTVFAIGTPLDPALQNTVTRGVVSAFRTLDGLAFIQSDVMVNRGNSGGPLLDEKGRVVGLTEIGLQPNGAPVGINLFIPVRDAIDFLALKLEPSPIAQR